MKHQNILLVACIFMFLVTCKKVDNNTGETIDKLTTVLNIERGAINVFSDTLGATHDTIIAINAVGQWLLDQPEVQDAYYWSKQMIEIRFKNGLRSSISFTWEDDDEQHLTRGGSSGSSKLFNYHGVDSKETIKNDKVLVMNPYTRQFNHSNYNKGNLFNGGPKVLDVTIVNDEAVTYDLLSTFGEYGFIILNTHGLPWGFCIENFAAAAVDVDTTNWTRDDVLNILNTWFGPQIPLEKFENGELETSVNSIHHDLTHTKTIIQLVVTDKFIRNSSLNLTGTVVFNNSCFSGNTKQGPTNDNQPEAFKSRGCISYYGYAFTDNSSGSVPGDFANQMEDSLIANLVRRGDTTGVAHLIDDVIPQYSGKSETSSEELIPIHVTRGKTEWKVFVPGLYDKLFFVHFFEPNYCYEKCGDTLTDARDGKKYATVCIGDQVWMAENLNYTGPGNCYAENASNCSTYGRMYTYKQVVGSLDLHSEANPSGIRGICPDGWHVPSWTEWEELFVTVGGQSVAATKLKSTTGWTNPTFAGTDDFGFTFLPGGNGNNGEVNPPPYTNNATLYGYSNIGKVGDVWTSSKNGNDELMYLIFTYSNDPFYALTNRSGELKYCRCVKD